MTLHHVFSGPTEGHVIVLVGSLGTTLAMWDPQVRALSVTHRVVAVDLPGHGGTKIPGSPCTVGGLAEDVVALVDRMGADRFSVVGLSFGGAAAQVVAARHPHRVAALVVACSALSFAERFWRERAATVRREGLTKIIQRATDNRFTADFRRREPVVAAQSLAELNGIDPEGSAVCCDALAWFTEPVASLITALTLVIAGELDEIIPPAAAGDLAGQIAEARLEIIAGVAHLANLERPERFTDLVRQHLALT